MTLLSSVTSFDQPISILIPNESSSDLNLAPEKIVQKILQRDRKADEEENAEEPFLASSTDESYWEKQEKLYLRFEQWIRKNNQAPTWEVAGPLHYGMTLSKMQKAIEQKFCNLVSSGLLIKESIFNKKRSDFYPPTGKGGDNLTRIWGAEYLNSNLSNQKDLKAAGHFLVVGDDADEIEVQVALGEYPYLSIIKNGHIVSKKIDGEERAFSYRSSMVLEKLRYKDFKDQGNIIQDANRINWIVDTELKSFDAPPIGINQYAMQTFLKKRFAVLAGEAFNPFYQTFKISLRSIIPL